MLHRVIAAHAAPAERERPAAAGEREAAGSSFLAATAYGVGGMIEDYLTYSRGWGFRPEEVESEVQVWHGGLDPLVPVEHALQRPGPYRRAASSSTPTRATTSFDVGWRRS